MRRTNKHIVLNKITGRNMETIYVSCEEMVDMINCYYIMPANSDEDYNAIWKTIKGNWIKTKKLVSKDEKYEICVSRHNRVGIFNAKDYNWMWVHDKEADKFYEYRAIFYGKFKREIKTRIAEKKEKGIGNAVAAAGQVAQVKQNNAERPAFCQHCGAKLVVDAVFCESCGSKVG